MPSLNEIGYSRDVTVTAVRDYYRFLVSMYLDESNIIEPPEGGWPSITAWEHFDKTDKVIDLLRHLPYIRITGVKQALGGPYCEFCDWQGVFPDSDGLNLKEWSEPDEDEAIIPAHIVGLTVHRRYGPLFLLDTELGVVYWPECRGEVKEGPVAEVTDDPYDWVDDDIIPEDQVEWRADSGIWAIQDFFGMLKSHFQNLNFVPIGPQVVQDVWISQDSEQAEMLVAAQKIYRKHGWPNVADYQKEACLAEIRSMLEARGGPDEIKLHF